MRLSFFFAFLASFVVTLSAIAAEPFLKPGDVIALVGGEDMVVASEVGYLELLLTRALPDFRLKFRNLAWEGDTVFEQRRDLNFPPLEAQLDAIGATVVLCQFGQMESLGKVGSGKAEGGSEEARKAKIAEFIAAYEELIERMSGGGKRRMLLISPQEFGLNFPSFEARNEVVREYAVAIHKLAERTKARTVMLSTSPDAKLSSPGPFHHTRDGVHLHEYGTGIAAGEIAMELGLGNGTPWRRDWETDEESLQVRPPQLEKLRQLIIAKNRLWFDYWRPQNWAFLAGDRTSQPSSRDHLDPTKRWFPAEREAFLPLIAAKEEAIWKLAAELK